MTNHADATQGDQKRIDGVAPETLRSLTVAQLSRAQVAAQGSDQLNCDDRPIKNVSLVGVVVFTVPSDTYFDVAIFDGTGTIQARQWLDDETDSARFAAMTPGKYVRIYGNFKGASAEKPDELGQIIAYSVRLIADHNEVVHHNLSVMFEHMHVTQGQNLGATGAQFPAVAGAPQPGGMANALQPIGAAPAVNCRDAVLAVLRGPDSAGEHGLHVTEIVRRLAGQFADAQVRTAIEQASADGHIYTTSTDEHFRSAEG